MDIIIEYYEWCRSVEPMWAGLVVWLTALISAILVAIWLVCTVVERMGLWLLWSIPAFIACCFYIAVFAQ